MIFFSSFPEDENEEYVEEYGHRGGGREGKGRKGKERKGKERGGKGRGGREGESEKGGQRAEVAHKSHATAPSTTESSYFWPRGHE